MPFAQWGYPHRQTEEDFRDQYPADYICEAIDQTRGWFYTLMAVGTLVFDESSYRTVLCLGLLLDKEGRKMSKHLGNVLEPIPLMDEHGADAVRWFMVASGSPWSARRVSHESIQEVVRKTLLTYWNTVSFQVLYAGLAGWSPSDTPVPVSDRPAMDRWLASRTQQLIDGVDRALDGFDAAAAGGQIATFVDELSNWYVRRSRRRFWDGDDAAFTTLHEALTALTLVMAPLTPFITERVWQDVVRPTTPGAADSVHLADWPAIDETAIDGELTAQMAQVRRLVELGRAARAASGVKTRQPLGRALVSAAGWQQMPPGGAGRALVRAQRPAHRGSRRRRRRAGVCECQGELPGPGQALRKADPRGGRGDRGDRPARPAAVAGPGRPRRGEPSATRRSSSNRTRSS